MLRSEEINPPCIVLVGHDLFYSETTRDKIDMERVVEFNLQLSSVCPFIFRFVDLVYSKEVGDTSKYFRSLKDLRVNLKSPTFFDPKKEEDRKYFSQMMSLCEVAFCSELVKAIKPKFRRQHSTVNQERFLNCLREIVILNIPFNRTNFALLEDRF